MIDTDVHSYSTPSDPTFAEYIPAKWRDYIDLIGLRPWFIEVQTPFQREFAHRTDSMPPSGRAPGGDPDFAREQLLEAFDMSGGILNNIAGSQFSYGSGGLPRQLATALSRANNEWHRDQWLAADPRWHASIVVPYDVPEEAVKEIEACRGQSDRFVQVLLGDRGHYPLGNPFYWPIYEAAEHYGIPVGFHPGGGRRATSCGQPSYYFELHTAFAARTFGIVSSMIFEGLFDRFPKLKIAFLEFAWSWAVPYGWRLDGAWRALRSEVPHLQRKPSEYLREHFWFATQPAEEPERLEWVDDVYAMFQETMGDKLMFSSDYPHWDFDAPTESIPHSLGLETRRKVLGETASALYKIPLREHSGVPAGEGLQA